jgi:hypothetical protein
LLLEAIPFLLAFLLSFSFISIFFRAPLLPSCPLNVYLL